MKNIWMTLVAAAVLAVASSVSARADDVIRYNDVVGVFSATEPVRLDVGVRATKENVPASHVSWATRLRIQRIDGPSRGVVRSGDIVGIFSEDGLYRLDIGTRAMKENVPASHVSWATRLRIRRLDGQSRGPVRYGDVVGIFSEDGRYRLDIGTRAMKENVPASHASWATELRISSLDTAAVASEFKRIRNRWKPDQYVHVERGQVEAGRISDGWWSAQWQVEPVQGTPFVRFRNRWKPEHYLHVERGPLESGAIEPGWWSAMWSLEPAGDGYYRLRNRWKPELCIHVEHGGIQAGPVQPGWWSAMWVLDNVGW